MSLLTPETSSVNKMSLICMKNIKQCIINLLLGPNSVLGTCNQNQVGGTKFCLSKMLMHKLQGRITKQPRTSSPCSQECFHSLMSRLSPQDLFVINAQRYQMQALKSIDSIFAILWFLTRWSKAHMLWNCLVDQISVTFLCRLYLYSISDRRWHFQQEQNFSFCLLRKIVVVFFLIFPWPVGMQQILAGSPGLGSFRNRQADRFVFSALYPETPPHVHITRRIPY